jgi:hypothetical protein
MTLTTSCATRLDRGQFAEREAWLLMSRSYAVSSFRYDSGVEAIRVRCGRGEFVWLPFLGQQIWDWKIDGQSRKFSGFVEEPAYGRGFLQNYGAFLVHCGMSAMGNPGPPDTHPQHGELSTMKFDRAWLELGVNDGEETLALCGSVRWHVPYQCDYRCVIKTFIDPSGAAAKVEIALMNQSGTPMEFMYLGHINWSILGASTVKGPGSLAEDGIRIRDEEANPRARAGLAAGAFEPASLRADPEFVAAIDDSPAISRRTESRLLLKDGSMFWVRQEKSLLDHHVIWITNTPDRGACGFHLPSTSGPDGLAAERAAGDVKVLRPRETVRMAYSFGYEHTQE